MWPKILRGNITGDKMEKKHGYVAGETIPLDFGIDPAKGEDTTTYTVIEVKEDEMVYRAATEKEISDSCGKNMWTKKAQKEGK
jgi:hypothetical protein